MKRWDNNETGVSPVIATILMIGVTVTLSASVFLIAGNYTELADGKPEIFVVDVDLHARGIEEIDGEGMETGHTYSGLSVDSYSRQIDWAKYKVTIDGERVFTVPSKEITIEQVPDASDDPAPINSGKPPIGYTQWFTEEGYRDDYKPLESGKNYHVVFVNIEVKEVVWMGEVTAS